MDLSCCCIMCSINLETTFKGERKTSSTLRSAMSQPLTGCPQCAWSHPSPTAAVQAENYAFPLTAHQSGSALSLLAWHPCKRWICTANRLTKDRHLTITCCLLATKCLHLAWLLVHKCLKNGIRLRCRDSSKIDNIGHFSLQWMLSLFHPQVKPFTGLLHCVWHKPHLNTALRTRTHRLKIVLLS